MDIVLAENDPFRNCWAYDIEVFHNCFTCTFVNMVNVENVKTFIIHEDVNQADELVAFWHSCFGLIGYNNLNFDNPIVQTQLLLQRNCGRLAARVLTKRIYEYAQWLLGLDFPPFMKPMIPQRDAYRIWHFDNPARATSLKWVQVAIKWHNVEDMPIHHTAWVTKDMLPKIMEYNLNDVLSTREFYLKKTLPKVKIRNVLSKRFRLDLHNANDPKIGEEIILSRLARKKGMDLWELKKMRTERPYVDLKDIILPEIQFASKPFQEILRRFKDTRVVDTRSNEEFKVLFDDLRYDFGFGGLHAARGNQIWTDLDSADVSSFYPNLAIHHGFYPEHLGIDFLEVYSEIYAERKGYPKKSPENEGLKLSLNGAFGKSNSQWSALFDMRMTLQITINGQLLLAMLCEQLTLSGAARVVMANTDGIEVVVKNRELYKQICKQWEENTRLELEHSKYKILAIRDVNNYIGIAPDGKSKEKGAYEVEKEIHKDQSMPIVAYAVREFFKTGKSIVATINECQDIWQFMMAVRAKTGEFTLRSLDHWAGDNTELSDVVATKTIRYYISKEGQVLIKKTEKKEGKQHSGVYIRVINRFVDMPFDQYGVDKQFYIAEANKLMVGVTKQSAGLFE